MNSYPEYYSKEKITALREGLLSGEDSFEGWVQRLKSVQNIPDYVPGTNPWYYILDGVLIKKQKPCVPGDMIHLTHRNGMYKVLFVEIDHFSVMINRQIVAMPWRYFKCRKGEGRKS